MSSRPEDEEEFIEDEDEEVEQSNDDTSANSGAQDLKEELLEFIQDLGKLSEEEGRQPCGLDCTELEQERVLEIEQARNEATAALTAAENDTRRFGAVSLALDRIQDQEAKVREYVVVKLSQLPALQDSLLMAVDEDEAARIEAAIAVEEERVAVQAETIFDQMGGVEARDLLAAELLSFTGTGANINMLSMEDVAGIEREAE